MTVLAVIIFFFFNDTATTEIYTLSLHDALPILGRGQLVDPARGQKDGQAGRLRRGRGVTVFLRSEEHTSELQSQSNLVCRLLLEKKKKIQIDFDSYNDALNGVLTHPHLSTATVP